MKKFFFKSVFVVALAALVVFVVYQPVQANETIDEKAIRMAKVEAELAAMRAEIKEKGYTFTVGHNPAMKYELEELVGFDRLNAIPLGNAVNNVRNGNLKRTKTLPSAFTGTVTSIKDQGACGSCWAFAAVGLMEAMILENDGVEVDLSEQHMLDCNPWDWGCNGGFWPNDMLVDTGSPYESCYPYLAYETPCDDSCPIDYTIQSWEFVTEDNVVPPTELIKEAIYTYGAVAAGVYVDRWFQAYTSGVLNRCKRRVNYSNHAIILCGWDDSKGDSGAWLLKNSWSTGWGEDGFMWIPYGCDKVGDGAHYFIY